MEAEKKKPTPFSFNVRSIVKFLQGVVFCLLVFAIVLAIYLLTLYRTRLAPFIHYGIVFDAGSSHTEMFVYHWPADKSDGLGTTSSVNELCVCQLAALSVKNPAGTGEPIKLKAISDFEQHLHLLDSYFQPCLEKAAQQIPASRHRLSPVFLGATAGMRLSRMHNMTRANQVLETIREIFANSPFQFVIARQVRILTGIEEAIDGWITTNILLEKFKHLHAQKKPMASNELDTDMVGVLDLGGASTQVTFTYNHTVKHERVPDEFTANITLFDHIYKPYAHSYLCWGKTEARKRYRARLLNSAIGINRTTFSKSGPVRIRDPCLARDANETMTADGIFRTACTAAEKIKFNPHINRTEYIFVGSGNASECRRRLTMLFDAKRTDASTNCTHKPEYCTFDHTFQPKIPDKIRFVGLSGYFYVFNNLAHGMLGTQQARERYRFTDFQEDQVKQRLINVCETNYSTLYKQENMTKATEAFKRGLCFDAWYVWLLLTYGIGFTKDDLKRLSFVKKFPTGEVGWTLGYMINQTNYIPAEYRERVIAKSSFVGWLTVSLIAASLAVIFLILTSYLFCRRPANGSSNAHDDGLRTNETEVT